MTSALCALRLDVLTQKTYIAISSTIAEQTRTPQSSKRCRTFGVIRVELELSDGASSCKIHVTQNCFAALQRLRYKKKLRLMWIDAVCLDQKNNEEKISQVRRMGEIYRLAKAVIVSLDEADEASKVVWGFINRYRKDYLAHRLFDSFGFQKRSPLRLV
ncbi:hypothetical protein BU25DRAFT_111491 [Macroventuria anomochaeta]|uniref:Uncharacterized protein n=1 Tax=Macroventuria anomochaeta TaxID=301207 RepID=A0ACB6RY49_9PLEO|nr:uncharacterized protein BU25DRAFT_111491 [Macroventuria anomochaeta]KAF2625807.1 hypothetical protein BU25DRAFT_111491 [Macroventuria anomochaeta]